MHPEHNKVPSGYSSQVIDGAVNIAELLSFNRFDKRRQLLSIHVIASTQQVNVTVRAGITCRFTVNLLTADLKGHFVDLL